MNAIVTRSQVDALEDAMRGLDSQVPVSSFVTSHFFTDTGLYAREIVLPKGTLISGKIKKHQYITVVSAGFVSIASEGGVEHIRAPYTMVDQPNQKRVVLAHEDSVITTIHACSSTDLDEVERELISVSYLEDLT
jgi:hypothetical protein